MRAFLECMRGERQIKGSMGVNEMKLMCLMEGVWESFRKTPIISFGLGGLL